MNASVVEETAAFAALFEGFERERAGLDPPFVLAARRAAFERFLTEGFPTTRQEAWRFTSVAPIARSVFRLPGPEDEEIPTGLQAPDLALAGALRVVFVNGRLDPALSSSSLVSDGVRVRSLRDVLADDPDGLLRSLGQLVGERANVFAALNTALFVDGALVEILPGASPGAPIHIVFASAPSESDPRPPVLSPRVLVLARRGSESSIVESHLGAARGCSLNTAVTEILVEEDARLDRCKLQQESLEAFHVTTLAVRQERGSRFADRAISLGAALARNDIAVALAGEGAECVLDGLFVARGSQHTDTHTHIDHAQPHCGSRELYKGILSDRSRGVFHGTILVRPGAQKTDALQVNRNLLLSREALVNSTPALEIRADDVKCKHGSTTGHLDPVALFYLRSRGLDHEAARSLLVHAFAGEVVARVRPEELRRHVSRVLLETLPGAPEGALS